MSDALTDLQIKVAFQENTIEELNTVLTNQQKQLNRLQQELVNLREKCESLEYSTTQPDAGPDQEKPPHY